MWEAVRQVSVLMAVRGRGEEGRRGGRECEEEGDLHVCSAIRFDHHMTCFWALNFAVKIFLY